MPRPQNEPSGELTPAQHEIMVLVWESGDAGLSVAEIWKEIADRRSVARTTVLNLVDRLEKRGWLNRTTGGGVLRYTAAVERTEAESRLAAGFVADFFGGSTAHLVQSLLGSRGVSADELVRMRQLLNDARADRWPTRPDDRRRGKGARP